jgi:hypothetical protein
MTKYILALILFIVSGNSYGQWTGAVYDSLTHNNVSDQVNRNCISINQNTLHVVFKRNAGAMTTIFYMRRDSLGNWDPEMQLSTLPANNPAICNGTSTHDVHIVYEATDSSNGDQEIYHVWNSGVTWNTMQLTNDTTEDVSPTVAVDGSGYVHIAWVGVDTLGNYKIFYANNRSGNYVSQILTASNPGPFGSGAAPQIAVESSGIAHIAYRAGNFGTYHIEHAYNSSPGDSTWTMDVITTLNAEDLIAAIAVSNDSLVHLVVNDNSGFGFPWSAYYMNKSGASGAYSMQTPVAGSFSGNLGGMFVDQNNIPHIVFNEVSGNFFTGNVIYADSTNWAGYLLTQTTDMYECNIVMDEQQNGYLLTYRGLGGTDEEVVLYGPQTGVGMTKIDLAAENIFAVSSNNKITLQFRSNYKGNVSCYSIEGKLIETKNASLQERQMVSFDDIDPGTYIITAGNEKLKVVVR